MKTTQTTFTYNTKMAANTFRVWLTKNTNDRDYGYPKFIDLREVAGGWCVEYSSQNEMARGVATGISVAADF